MVLQHPLYSRSLTFSQAAKRAVNLLRTIQFSHPPSCPCHSNPGYHNAPPSITSQPARLFRRSYATPLDHSQQKEYAFEMAASSIRFGPGVTQEVGMDFKNMGSQRVAVVTDETVDKLFAMQQVRESLDREKINYKVFNKVKIEPKDSSFVPHQLCISFVPF
jgi:hydroxyacid-oxoacid transhydrogenase